MKCYYVIKCFDSWLTNQESSLIWKKKGYKIQKESYIKIIILLDMRIKQKYQYENDNLSCCCFNK